MRIVIPGEPRGKQRPRFSRRTGATYTPSETVQYEKTVKTLAQASGRPVDGPVVLSVDAMYAIPKSVAKAKKEAMEYGDIRPEKKPDIDNVVKIIMDALNGVAYKDDKQVVEVRARKFYDENPRVIIVVTPLDQPENETMRTARRSTRETVIRHDDDGDKYYVTMKRDDWLALRREMRR